MQFEEWEKISKLEQIGEKKRLVVELFLLNLCDVLP